MNLSPTLLKMFLLVVDCGSLAAAARTMGISAAAVSKQLHVLEARAGSALLARTTRHLSLTPAGMVLQDYARSALRSWEEQENACLSQIRGAPTGILRVVAARVLGQRLLVPSLARFIDRYPAVELDIDFAEHFPEMDRDPVDLVFGMSQQAAPGLKRRSIGRTSYWLCAAPAYLERHGSPANPDALAAHRLIAHSGRQPPNELVLKDGWRRPMKAALVLDDSTAMLDAARQGIGLVSLHRYMVEEDVLAGRLIRLLPRWERTQVSVDILYRNTGKVPAALRGLIDHIAEHCRLDRLQG